MIINVCQTTSKAADYWIEEHLYPISINRYQYTQYRFGSRLRWYCIGSWYVSKGNRLWEVR